MKKEIKTSKEDAVQLGIQHLPFLGVWCESNESYKELVEFLKNDSRYSTKGFVLSIS